MTHVWASLAIVPAFGVDTFAVAVGLGVAGVAQRRRLAVVVAVFEGGMPIVGALVGGWVGRLAAGYAVWAAAALLAFLGGRELLEGWRELREDDDDDDDAADDQDDDVEGEDDGQPATTGPRPATGDGTGRAGPSAPEGPGDDAAPRASSRERAQTVPGALTAGTATAPGADRTPPARDALSTPRAPSGDRAPTAPAGEAAHLLRRGLTGWGLVAAGLGVSLDELGAGLAAGTAHLSLPLLVPALALQAGLFTYLGVHAGGALRRWAGRYGEIAAGLALIAVAVAVVLLGRR